MISRRTKLKRVLLALTLSIVLHGYSISAHAQCDTPMIQHDTLCSSGQATLVSSIPSGITQWWDAPSGGNKVHFGNVFEPTVTGDSTFYAERVCGVFDTIDMVSGFTQYNGYSRGYWFIAPTDFVITGLRVSDTYSTGVQHVAVIHVHTMSFDFNNPTTDITTLYFQDSINSNAMVPMAIPVSTGDTIGILGSRDYASNDYGSGPFTTYIDGNAVSIQRFGMQDEMADISPQTTGVWGVTPGGSGSIGIVDLQYLIATDTSNRVEGHVILSGGGNYIDSNVVSAVDTFTTSQGTIVTESGIYIDTISTSLCGDSLEWYDVTITNRFFVDSTTSSSGNGNSWGSAFKTLKEALTAANASQNTVEIWVTGGTYKPTDDGSTGNQSTFLMTNINTKLYGGFAGSETDPSQRSSSNAPSILSGDIGVQGDNSDNAHHVISIIDSRPVSGGEEIMDDDFVIDGFTIRDGNASGGSKTLYSGKGIWKNSGGGLYIYS